MAWLTVEEVAEVTEQKSAAALAVSAFLGSALLESPLLEPRVVLHRQRAFQPTLHRSTPLCPNPGFHHTVTVQLNPGFHDLAPEQP